MGPLVDGHAAVITIQSTKISANKAGSRLNEEFSGVLTETARSGSVVSIGDSAPAPKAAVDSPSRQVAREDLPRAKDTANFTGPYEWLSTGHSGLEIELTAFHRETANAHDIVDAFDKDGVRAAPNLKRSADHEEALDPQCGGAGNLTQFAWSADNQLMKQVSVGTSPPKFTTDAPRTDARPDRSAPPAVCASSARAPETEAPGATMGVEEPLKPTTYSSIPITVTGRETFMAPSRSIGAFARAVVRVSERLSGASSTSAMDARSSYDTSGVDKRGHIDGAFSELGMSDAGVPSTDDGTERQPANATSIGVLTADIATSDNREKATPQPLYAQLVPSITSAANEISTTRRSPLQAPTAPTDGPVGDDVVKSLRITLTPERLGQVEVRLTLRRGELGVRIDVDNIESAEALRSQRRDLVEALSRVGVALHGLVVGGNEMQQHSNRSDDAQSQTLRPSTATDTTATGSDTGSNSHESRRERQWTPHARSDHASESAVGRNSGARVSRSGMIVV